LLSPAQPCSKGLGKCGLEKGKGNMKEKTTAHSRKEDEHGSQFVKLERSRCEERGRGKQRVAAGEKKSKNRGIAGAQWTKTESQKTVQKKREPVKMKRRNTRMEGEEVRGRIGHTQTRYDKGLKRHPRSRKSNKKTKREETLRREKSIMRDCSLRTKDILLDG